VKKEKQERSVRNRENKIPKMKPAYKHILMYQITEQKQ